jgi:hypothetical protein
VEAYADLTPSDQIAAVSEGNRRRSEENGGRFLGPILEDIAFLVLLIF